MFVCKILYNFSTVIKYFRKLKFLKFIKVHCCSCVAKTIDKNLKSFIKIFIKVEKLYKILQTRIGCCQSQYVKFYKAFCLTLCLGHTIKCSLPIDCLLK